MLNHFLLVVKSSQIWSKCLTTVSLKDIAQLGLLMILWPHMWHWVCQYHLVWYLWFLCSFLGGTTIKYSKWFISCFDSPVHGKRLSRIWYMLKLNWNRAITTQIMICKIIMYIFSKSSKFEKSKAVIDRAERRIY